MSYIVEIIRPIKKEEVIRLAGADDSLVVDSEGEDWLELNWTGEKETANFSYSQSRLVVTTPTDEAYKKAKEIASLLNAEIIGEEEKIRDVTISDSGIIEGRSTWLGWPILVIILIILLLWKW
jgi:hypothetical protein